MQTNQRAYHTFLRRVCDWGNLTEWEAEEASAAVLCAFEGRLPKGGAALRPMLEACPRHEVDAPMSLGRESLARHLQRELGVGGPQADDVVHAVLAAVRSLVSAGDAAEIAAALPEDLRVLWERPVLDRSMRSEH